MKKRFTVMLEESTINMIKDLHYSPTPLRELIEETLEVMAYNEAHDKLTLSIAEYREIMRTGQLPNDKQK